MGGLRRFVRGGRRGRKRAGVLSAAFLAAGPVSGAGIGVSAASPRYPQEQGGCFDDALTFNIGDEPVDEQRWEIAFQNNGSDVRPLVVDAIRTIDDAQDFDGTRLVTVAQDPDRGPNIVDVKPADLPLSDYGSADCLVPPSGDQLVQININHAGSRYWWKVSRHEMMHLAGAQHGGDRDSVYDATNPPTMSTCNSFTTFYGSNILHQDDAAYLNYLHSSLPDRQLHANWGFEQDSTYWDTSAGSISWKSSGGSGQNAGGHVAWSSPSINDYLWNGSVVHTGDDSESYQAVVHAKQVSSDYKTVVLPTLYARTIDHTAPDNDCDYPDGVDNPNDYTAVGNYVKVAGRSDPLEPQSEWTGFDSPFATPAVSDGYQFQIRVYGLTTHRTTGAIGPVLIDNARGDNR